MSFISEFETLKEKCFVLCMKIVILHFYQILINNVTFCLTYTYQVLVLILLTCGVCWYHFVFDLRLLTHSCVFLWIIDETMLLTISVKWLMWHSAISRAKWIEGKQIYKWWGKLLVWKSKTNVQFTLAITQTPLSEYRTYCIYMREECPSPKVTCICWHTYNFSPRHFLKYMYISN